MDPGGLGIYVVGLGTVPGGFGENPVELGGGLCMGRAGGILGSGDGIVGEVGCWVLGGYKQKGGAFSGNGVGGSES